MDSTIAGGTEEYEIMETDQKPGVHALKEASDLIAWACGRYDAGMEEMALQIAAAAKPLFHADDTGSRLFHHHQAVAISLQSTTSLASRNGNTLGFIMMAPNKSGFQPELNRSTRSVQVPLDDWWGKEPVLRFPSTERTVTRKQIVLAATGDFADPSGLSAADLDQLKNGWDTVLQVRSRGGPSRMVALKSAHLAILRQIGYEILNSPDFQRLASKTPGTSLPHSGLPPRLDIEKEMNQFVKALGGKLVADLVGPSPNFANADYVFAGDNVICELKCLTEDKTEDDGLQKKLDDLFNDCVERGLIPDPGPGHYVIQSDRLPVEVQRKIYAMFARPIKRRLDKANKQIKSTKARLNLPDARGLVLLANDGNFRLQPAQWWHAVNLALGRDYSAINSIVLFTVNMLSVTPRLAKHANLWIPATRSQHAPVAESFLRRLREGWTGHVASLLKEPVEEFQVFDHEALQTLKYDRTISKRQG